MTQTQQPKALRFTKKPVTITASQWFKSGDHPAVRDISDSDDLFFTGMGGATLVEREKFGVIGTLESPNHLVSPGDWIITGVKGEHYPCKPDIFEATYAPQPSPTTQVVVPQWDGVVKPSDFVVDTFRSGSGGWDSKPDNCVRITHRPTGFIEEESATRSVHANKVVAWQRLSDRLVAVLPPQQTTPTTQQAVQQCWRVSPSNFIAHRAARRKVLETAKIFSNGDDRSYWDRELAAFDRSFDRLWVLMQDAPQTSPTAQVVDSQAAIDRDHIREISMAHGFTVKEGQTDLKQYIYDDARRFLKTCGRPKDDVDIFRIKFYKEQERFSSMFLG